ncbi:MAG TPA: potassium channel family protein [Gaiellaceae bacterium]|jgi:voltage-gated potassium channel
MNDRARRVQRVFAYPVLVAALSTIPVIAIEQSSVGAPWDTVGHVVNWISWLVFLGEVVAMLAVVDDRRRWARLHLIEIFLVALTPPVLPPGLQSLRAVRLLRLLRLLRVPQLMRGVFSLEGLRFAGFLAVLTAVGGGAAFEAAERNAQTLSFGDALWWSITTMTTVGSNIYPATGLGKLVAVVVMLIGIGFIALVTGAVAERFLRPAVVEIEEEVQELERSDPAGDDQLVQVIAELRQRLDHLEALLARR